MQELGIIHLRVDDRLIHGLVATMWSSFLGATRLMVIDDETASNEMIKTSLKIATPAGMKLSVLTVEKAIHNILSKKYVGQRVMIIVKTPVVFWQLKKAGIDIDSINMGNISYLSGRTKVAKTVSVTEADVEAVKQLTNSGVKINYQLTTSDPIVNFVDLLKAAHFQI